MSPRTVPLYRTAVALATMTFVLLYLFCAPSVLAQHTLPQHTQRDLTGTVTDRHHEPLKGAVVEVHDEATDAIVSYITDRSGRYSFKRLDGETDYRVWATYRGQRSQVRKLSQFDTKKVKTLDLVIQMQ